MRIALAQLNTTVGDLAGNEAKILATYRRAAEAGAEMVVCPELAVTGYPPRDLLLKRRFIAENLAMLNRLASATNRTGLLAGYVGENGPRSNQFGRAFAAREDCGHAHQDAVAYLRRIR